MAGVWVFGGGINEQVLSLLVVEVTFYKVV
jgi:hypothetical protein